ncbi:MAG: ABC transporter substrate-binding protein [Peptoniphilaceae bacterium]|nr:ABC transporter substrate-binding protein [Peptoniphilaceae bacterium]MDY6019005.1 ABC transporter substrate-binding protein [Anaerococcus sp.]
MNSKKLIRNLMATALSLAVLAGCGNKDTSTTSTSNEGSMVEGSGSQTSKNSDIVTKLDGETKIVFWHAMGGGQGEALEKLVKEFEEKNPNIKIDLQNQGNYGDLSQKLTATMQSPDDLPTITQAYGDWMVPFLEEDFVVDLKPYIENKEIGFDNYDDILEGLREETTKDGMITSLPFNKSTEVLWYNKTLFDELGLEVPKTFEELKEVSQKIYEKKKIPGVGFDALSNFYASYLKDKGLDMDSKLDVSGKESKEAINYYLDGIKDGYFRIAGTDQYMSGPFANEQVAAYIGSNAGEVYIKDGVGDKFDYEAAPYPAGQSVQQGTNIYMFNNASDEQKTAAYEFLKFLTSKDAQIEFGLATGYMPIRKSAIEDEKYTNSDSKIAKVLSEATKNLFSRKVEPGSQQAYNDTSSFLESVLSNKDTDVDKELETFKQTYESAYQQ